MRVSAGLLAVIGFSVLAGIYFGIGGPVGWALIAILVLGDCLFLSGRRQIAIQILSILGVVALWWSFSTCNQWRWEQLGEIMMGYHLHDLPSPPEAASAFWSGLFPKTIGITRYESTPVHLWASIKRILIGFVIAAGCGIPIGLWIGCSRYGKWIAGTLTEVIRPIPPLAWIPIALILFAWNAPVFIVFLGVVFPIILNTASGVRGVEPELIEAGLTLGARPKDIVLKILLPASIPSTVTGMRIGLGIGWMCIVAAEMVGMREGLGIGYYLWMEYGTGHMDNVVVAMIIIGVVGWIMNMIVELVERKTCRR